MKATIWHNPRCSKSREALAILHETGAEVTVVEYLKTPLNAAEIGRVLSRAGLAAGDAIRRGEPGAAALAGADEATLVAAMAADPILIERPIVETAKGVRLGRPPERVREIL